MCMAHDRAHSTHTHTTFTGQCHCCDRKPLSQHLFSIFLWWGLLPPHTYSVQVSNPNTFWFGFFTEHFIRYNTIAQPNTGNISVVPYIVYVYVSTKCYCIRWLPHIGCPLDGRIHEIHTNDLYNLVPNFSAYLYKLHADLFSSTFPSCVCVCVSVSVLRLCSIAARLCPRRFLFLLYYNINVTIKWYWRSVGTRWAMHCTCNPMSDSTISINWRAFINYGGPSSDLRHLFIFGFSDCLHRTEHNANVTHSSYSESGKYDSETIENFRSPFFSFLVVGHGGIRQALCEFTFIWIMAT